MSGFFVRFNDSKCLLTLQKGTNVAAKYLNFFLNFLLTNIKKCGIILGLAGGVPVDNLWISRPRRKLQSGTSF